MITTFDNKQWNKEELLANMYDDSFYYGYLGQNALSSSTIKTLVNSPKTYYFTTNENRNYKRFRYLNSIKQRFR